MKRLVFCTILALVANVACCADSVRFISFGEAAPATPVPATFDDRTRQIEVEFDGSAGATGSLHADLFQVAGQLALPLAKNIELQKNVTLAEATRIRFTLKFPAVQRRTEILTRLVLIPAGGNPIALGELKFEVFPKSTTTELTEALQSKDKTARAVLFGPGDKLRQFLKSQHVPFEEGGDGLPDNFTSTLLYIGELKDAAQFQQLQDRSPNARVLVFAPDDTLPPGVYLERSSGGALAHVTSPLLDNLADNPRAQSALTKIINLLSTPSTNPSSL